MVLVEAFLGFGSRAGSGQAEIWLVVDGPSATKSILMYASYSFLRRFILRNYNNDGWWEMGKYKVVEGSKLPRIIQALSVLSPFFGVTRPSEPLSKIPCNYKKPSSPIIRTL